MDNLKAKQEERAEKVERYAVLVEKSRTEKLTEPETKELDTLAGQIDALEGEIKKLQEHEDRLKKVAASKPSKSERLAVGAPQDNASERKEAMKYSFAKAAVDSTHRHGRPADGLEREIYDEAEREAKEAGITLTGNIAVPGRFIDWGAKTRAPLTISTESADVVFQDYGGLIPILRPDPVCIRAGMRVLSGLRGDVKFPRITGETAWAWETEVAAANEATPTTDNVQLAPLRVSGYTDISKKFLAQSPFVVESFMRESISATLANVVDSAVINGAGSNDPTGLLSISGVNSVALGTNGGDVTYGAILNMKQQCEAGNTRRGRDGFLTNANVKYALSRTAYQSSGVEGNFIYNPMRDGNNLCGSPAYFSENVPSNLTKGSGSSLSALVYSSRWESALWGQWGGLDVLYDPYTQAGTATVRFVYNMFADFDIEQPEEFAIIEDINTTVPALT